MTTRNKPPGELRRGWTTGACAAAAAKAAYQALLTGGFPDPVTITLPRGQTPAFALAREDLARDHASAGIIKDAGDDPDVTHGALVIATVRRGAVGAGITYRAGAGVGTVTRPGLPIPPGEPAINPGPRAQIAQAIAEVTAAWSGSGDVDVTVSIPGGAELAKRTLNGRLGIVGGLSILGTTGIVVPFSCASWIHSIQRGIDVARAAGLAHIVGATGSTSEAAAKRLYGLDDIALIDMGDFVGGMLKYLRRHPVPRVTIAGGFGKLAKLAAGSLDLHSGASRIDVHDLAKMLAELGANETLVDAARQMNSAAEIMIAAGALGRPLADLVARRARATALATLAGNCVVDVAVFDRAGALIGRAGLQTD
ncbi:MAG: cobalt-precorrin-5B (C(1))-methyltransferase [Alphaproteobacteria bacterium]|nr:cobalt-precorrin-5B (C(1))-methyltransferase [Alphaproteobacteria bacterium]